MMEVKIFVVWAVAGCARERGREQRTQWEYSYLNFIFLRDGRKRWLWPSRLARKSDERTHAM